MRLTRFAAAALTSLALAGPALAAQPKTVPQAARERASAPAQGAAAPTSGDPANADDVRNRLDDVLRQYPPSLARVLALDPTLLDNPGYLQPYPELAAFLVAHPDVKHNPGFYLANYETNLRGGAPYRFTTQDRALDMWNRAIE